MASSSCCSREAADTRKQIFKDLKGGRAERHQSIRAQPRQALAPLAFKPDDGPEPHGYAKIEARLGNSNGHTKSSG
jgi:hypothetical protein